MARKRRAQTDTKDDDRRLLDITFEAASSLDWFLPETEQEVQDTEKDELTAELPASLTDPYAVLNGALASQQPSAQSREPNSTITSELARAARNGKDQIPPEVAELMKQHRAEATQRLRDDGS